MFTIEHDHEYNETVVTILDTTEEFEDVTVHFTANGDAFIRQWEDNLDNFNVIGMTADMYRKLMKAWELPQGAYHFKQGEK